MGSSTQAYNDNHPQFPPVYSGHIFGILCYAYTEARPS